MSSLNKLRARIQTSLGLRDRTDTWVISIEKYKIAYVPVPKAANTSMRWALLPLLGIDPSTVDNIHQDDRITKLSSSEFLVASRKDWLIFAVVRHPEDRALSAWKNKLKDPPKPFRRLAQMGLKREDSFETFLQVIANWPSHALNDHFAPQTALLKRLTVKTDLEIFKIEELDQWWPTLNGRLEERSKISPGPIRRLNPSKIRPQNSLSPLAKELLFQIYAEDYQQFGYQV